MNIISRKKTQKIGQKKIFMFKEQKNYVFSSFSKTKGLNEKHRVEPRPFAANPSITRLSTWKGTRWPRSRACISYSSMCWLPVFHRNLKITFHFQRSGRISDGSQAFSWKGSCTSVRKSVPRWPARRKRFIVSPALTKLIGPSLRCFFAQALASKDRPSSKPHSNKLVARHAPAPVSDASEQ